jgi:NAD(P)-dependent dehydrogenase (short-subunit alcohol dehydrogenase family)
MAIKDIKAKSGGSGALEAVPMDLANFDTVRAAAKILETKNITHLFLNAGMAYTNKYKGPWLTSDGYDQLMASNFLGHFLLCELLLPTIKKTVSPRVIITSSIMHWVGRPDDLFRRHRSLQSSGPLSHARMYGTSKLANLLHAYELQRRLTAERSNAIVIPLTPGCVATEIFNSARGAPSAMRFLPIAVSTDRGADTAIYAAALSPPPPQGTWCLPYLAPTRVGWLSFLPVLCELLLQRLTWRPRIARTSPETYDERLAGELWAFAEQAVGLAPRPGQAA